jgi:hypothetical protein
MLCPRESLLQHLVACNKLHLERHWESPQRNPWMGANGSAGHISGAISFPGNFSNSEDTHPVSFFPCSQCGQRAVGKLAAVYANWFNENEEREAWRKRLCVGCLTGLMGSLQASRDITNSNLTVCPACGEDASQTLSGIFLTIYPPKQSEREYALTMCGSCADGLREILRNGADRLGDRGVGAAAPTTTPSSVWDQVPW